MNSYALSSCSENVSNYDHGKIYKRGIPPKGCSSFINKKYPNYNPLYFSLSTHASYFVIRESQESYSGKISKGELLEGSAKQGSGFSSSRLSRGSASNLSEHPSGTLNVNSVIRLSTLTKSTLPTKQNKYLSTLSDTALLAGLKSLRGKERKVQLDILLYITEVEKRGLYLPMGYNSIFEFCTRHLMYSRAGAYRRIQASRCIERFPEIADLLITGGLNISLVSLISGVLTKENIRDILSLVSGKSYREAEIAIVKYKPIETITRDKVRPVCVLEKKKGKNNRNDPGIKSEGDRSECLNVETKPGAPNPEICLNVETNHPNYNNINTSENATPQNPETTLSKGTSKDEVELKQKFKLEFMVNPEFMEKLEIIKSGLSRKYPEGVNFEMLFTILMDEYLNRYSPDKRIERREKRKVKREVRDTNRINKQEVATNNKTKEKAPVKTNNPNKLQHIAKKLEPKPKKQYDSNNKKRSRNIPLTVRDLIYKRDGGRCTYVSKNGKRCNSTWNLEIDHIVPFARGGDNSPGNLRLLCAKHNRLEARRAYGEDFMKQYIKRE